MRMPPTFLLSRYICQLYNYEDFCVGGPTICRALSPDLVKLPDERTTRYCEVQEHGMAAVVEGFFTRGVAETDPELARAIAQELRRQQDKIEPIASENIVSRSAMEAQGSVLTNKYAEGYPGRR